MRRAIAVLCLLALALVPIGQSSGGVISSIQITGNNLVGEGPIDLNITLTGVGGASSASVTWNASLTDIEGNLIDSDSGNILVDQDIFVYVESTLGLAPLGVSNLTISLTGDVGTPDSTQWILYEETITRLRPLNISIGEPIFNAIDENGDYTNNLTVNDGDFVEINLPVINSGDIDWVGGVNMTVDGVITNSTNMTVLGDETKITTFQLGPLSEGNAQFEFELFGTQDTNQIDNILSSSLQVHPPPLPSLAFNLTRLVEPSAGSNVEWNLHVSNTGESDFVGNITCTFEQQIVKSVSSNLSVNEQLNISVSMLSKPGLLNCTSDGTRTVGTSSVTDILDFQSAIITGVGQNSPSFINGPWHVGDTISVSILVRNEGDAVGNAALEFIDGNESYISQYISLESGGAGEITHVLNFQEANAYLLNWSIVSYDSSVDDNLSGIINLPVEPAQDLTIVLDDLNKQGESTLVDWSIDLASGVPRDVKIEYGSIIDGDKEVLISEERTILPGVTYGDMNLGSINADQIFVKVRPIGWIIGLGSTVEDQKESIENNPIPSVAVNPITQPRVPKEGQQVTLQYTLSNTGEGGILQSEVIVTDDSNSIIGIQTINAQGKSSEDYSIVVDWPDGENVVITVTWYVDDLSYSDQILVKSELVESEDSDFSLPIGGILGGLALGMLVIFAIRVKNSPKSDKPKKKVSKQKKPKSNEKVEVSCPTCDRRLRVPGDYSGAVRCPECETKFDVESKIDPEDEQLDEDEEPEQKDEADLWSSSDNDILGCPKCSRKLKVPYEKRPAKARCPACGTIFEARAN